MASSAPICPTKLFIGGISKDTSSKKLRQHFSQYARVLDCVAMCKPDGSSRGFGLVTLDSVVAAERCLAEPMIIDGRVVDMKMAVPDKASSGGWQERKRASHPAQAKWDSVAGISQEWSQWSQAATTPAPAPKAMSASAPEFVPLVAVAAAKKKAVPEVAAEDTLVFAEDYVSFLEDQQRLCAHKKAAALPAPAHPDRSATRPPPGFDKLPIAESKETISEETSSEIPSISNDDAERPQSGASEADCESVVPASAEDLPSVGSLLHASGECRLCNFHRRGCCASGKDCSFCHLPHEKFKAKRLGKRERQAALAKQEKGDKDVAVIDADSVEPRVPAVKPESMVEDASVRVAAVPSVDMVELLAYQKGPSSIKATQQWDPAEADSLLAAMQGEELHAYAMHKASATAGNSQMAEFNQEWPAFQAPAPVSFVNFADYMDSDEEDSDNEEVLSKPEPTSTLADAASSETVGAVSRVEMLRLRALMFKVVDETTVNRMPRLSERC